MTETVLSARRVRKRFRLREGEILALKELDLDVQENEFICIVGPSGCGKSTFLRMAAGLEPVSEGEILYRGQPVKVPRREVGMVFQEYSLLPWRTVEDNVALGLEFAGTGREERRKVAREYLELVDLAAFARAMPHELSGGMRQRVAIARALANRPDVLLMDEPFGALDAQTRTQLQTELLETWEREKKTCFFITHDVEEAIILAQRVIIMSARPGRIKDIVDVNIPYPRTQETKLTPEFNELKNHIWSQVYQEYLAVRK